MGKKLIANGRIVTPEEVFRGSVVIAEGKILRIEKGVPENSDFDEVTDAEGMFVMPGFVDIHNDAIERELQPRPNVWMPFELFFHEIDKKLAASGISTVYHSVSYGEGASVRDCEEAVGTIRKINLFKDRPSMIRHKIHVRYEISYYEGVATVIRLLNEKLAGFVSYMDHTPGKGQYTDDKDYVEYAKDAWGLKTPEAVSFIQDLRTRRKHIEWKILREICTYARQNGIRVAMHDSCTVEEIERCLEWGIDVCEFPVNLHTAVYAASKGMTVCVGAPNIIRGKSHVGNLSALDAIENNSAHVICSDYSYSSMLQAVFKAAGTKGRLHEAVAMASRNPAEVAGIGHLTGSIEVGKAADIVIVQLVEGYPLVRKTLVQGEKVFEGNYFSKPSL